MEFNALTIEECIKKYESSGETFVFDADTAMLMENNNATGESR